MRIGILSHNYPRFSTERKDAGVFIYDFAKSLNKKESVFVFAPDFGGKKESYKNIPVTWFDWNGSHKKLGDWNLYSPYSLFNFFNLLFFGSKKAISFIKINKIDYCLAAWSIPSGIYAYFIKKILGTPYGVWNLGSDINKYAHYPILSSLITLSLKNADHVFANSFNLVKKVENLTSRKVFMLPAVTRFDLIGNKKESDRSKKFKFLFVGRLEKVKAPDILLSAVNILRSNYPDLDFSVNILGDGTMKQQLKNQINKLKISDVVNLVGWADERMVAKYMISSDCLLVTSRSESLPLVILEAAKANLPVIASDVGDCSFLIKKYKIGFTFPNGEDKALANCMRKIIKENNFKKSGFASLTQDFSLEKSTKLFTHKVLEVLNTK